MKKTDLIKLSIGQIGNAMAFMVMFLFLPKYYESTVFPSTELSYTLSYLIISISFAAGAITYIFAGYLSDRTHTRWGKRRPYFLLAIPSGIAYLFLGLVIPSFSIISMFIFLSAMASIYAVLYRLEYCSFWSLYMDLTVPEERITTSIIFNLFGTAGTIAALVLTPILEKFLSYFTITIIVGIFFIGSVLFAFLFGPREDLSKANLADTSTNLFKTIKETISDRNFFYYLVASFFFVLGYSISVLILIPFIKEQSVDLLLLLITILPFAIFYFILFGRLVKKWGRLKAFNFAIKIGILIIPITIFLIAGNIPLHFIQVFLIILIILFVVIAILTFQYAILMDLAPSGRFATYAGLYLFIIVIPIPISSTLIGPILDFLKLDIFIWHGTSYAFAIIFLITFIFLSTSYFFLRKIHAKEN